MGHFSTRKQNKKGSKDFKSTKTHLQPSHIISCTPPPPTTKNCFLVIFNYFNMLTEQNKNKQTQNFNCSFLFSIILQFIFQEIDFQEEQCYISNDLPLLTFSIIKSILQHWHMSNLGIPLISSFCDSVFRLAPKMDLLP